MAVLVSNIVLHPMERIIGRGAFAVVYKLHSDKHGCDIACKRISLRNGHIPTEAIREIYSYQRIHSQNSQESGPAHIVRFLGVDASPGHIDLEMEYMSGGTLGKIIRSARPLSPTTLWSYSHQIVLGIEYLHRNRIIHRDIKPENILLTDKGTVKIGDLGLSKVHAELTPSTPLVCTYTYRSPTLLCRNLLTSEPFCYGFDVDMWAVGCVITELARGSALFTVCDHDSDPSITGARQIDRILDLFEINHQGQNGLMVLQAACKEYRHPEEQLLGLVGADFELIDLIKRLLVLRDETRLTAGDTLFHPYFVSSV